MSADFTSAVAPWLTVALIATAAAAALAALSARSLFVMSVTLAAMTALAAGAALGAGAGESAFALAAFGVGLAPVVLLAGVLLSARAVKNVRAGWRWLALLGGVGAVAVIAFVAPDLARAPVGAATQNVAPSGLWFTGLVFVVAVVCAGLLGYGERGVLERSRTETEQ